MLDPIPTTMSNPDKQKHRFLTILVCPPPAKKKHKTLMITSYRQTAAAQTKESGGHHFWSAASLAIHSSFGAAVAAAGCATARVGVGTPAAPRHR